MAELTVITAKMEMMEEKKFEEDIDLKSGKPL
jgi:hypothetical protein